MSLKTQIHAYDLHQEDSLLTCKASIPSIVNILNRIIIPIDVYEQYVSKFYDYHHVEFYNLELKLFFNQRLGGLEHPSLITKWTCNMDKHS